ncbi:hypothetical protein AMATHDRAFT_6598 [Amanita thiersii Skay4041]|uniref:Uncharacterized protein n=1 Tax=Amanita thiersii Skay4041 TaxID=703135 RepID=A0A2A9NC12_9AGAR|nr:hypothetical protein AMATHDRAFT_6598 [Amanita thiersii Skay4041]
MHSPIVTVFITFLAGLSAAVPLKTGNSGGLVSRDARGMLVTRGNNMPKYAKQDKNHRPHRHHGSLVEPVLDQHLSGSSSESIPTYITNFDNGSLSSSTRRQ